MDKFQMSIEKPPLSRGRVIGEELAAIFKFVESANGEWCRVAERETGAVAGAVAAQWKRRWSKRGYDFVSRTIGQNGSKKFYVFCRFVGSKS